MKILFIRHGETDWNKNEKIQGTSNIPLNETGIKTSLQTGCKLNDYNITYAYSSNLDRAIHTAKLMLEGSIHKNIPLKIDEKLIEKSFGSLESCTFEEYKNAVKNHQDNDVEKDESVYNRILKFFKEIYDKHPDETIMVVSHGGCIRTFLLSENLIPTREQIYLNPQNEKYRRLKNNSIHEMDYDGHKFTLVNFDL